MAGLLGNSPPQAVGNAPANPWFDQARLAAAIAAQRPGADGRTVLNEQSLLSALAPLSGLKLKHAGGTSQQYDAGMQSMQDVTSPDEYAGPNGKTWFGVSAPSGQDPNAKYVQYNDGNGGSLQNPNGNGGKDRLNPIYKVNADGTATPVQAGGLYSPSEWVRDGQAALTSAGLLAAAYGGSAALGAAGGAGAGSGAALADSSLDAGLTGGVTGAGGGSVAGAGGVTGGSFAGANGALLNPADYSWAGSGASGISSLPAGASNVSWSALPDAASAGGGGGLLSGAMGPGALGNGGGFLGSTLGDGSGVFGSGLSLGQVGGLVGAVGGALGSGSSLNSATTQNKIDPNLKPYVYGQNGLIPQANNVLQHQMATGGLNANQTAGLNSQLAVLNNPGYSAGFDQAKTLGQSLMGQGVAANPFTSGQASLTPSPTGLMANGASLLPGQQGLLNQRKTIMPVTGGGLLGA